MEFERKYLLDRAINEVKGILMDLPTYSKSHPLIQSVQKIGAKANEYKIQERPYSWIPINVYYTALVKADGNKIEYTIKGLPFTEAGIEYLLNEIREKETQVLFKLKIENKIFAGKLLAKKMLKAQDQLMESINLGFQE